MVIPSAGSGQPRTQNSNKRNCGNRNTNEGSHTAEIGYTSLEDDIISHSVIIVFLDISISLTH